jgi:DNA modification methylase
MQADQVVFKDCLTGMRDLDDGIVDLVFNDPPFNIGLQGYDVYDDKRPYDEIYVAICDEFEAEVSMALKAAGFSFRNNITWYYTFGEAQRNKFNRTHTNILYYTKSPTDFTFNTEAIKVPSARQWKYKDKRAKAGGKLPDDVWEIPATEWLKSLIRCKEDARDRGMSEATLDALVDEITCAFIGDMWKISRVCGSFKERLKDIDGSSHPCQMPLSVLHRIIKASSNEGDLVLDCFCGTGTTATAAKQLRRHYLTYEISKNYFDLAQKRLAEVCSLEIAA